MVFGQVALPIELIYGKPTTDTEISDSCEEYAYQLQQTLDRIHVFIFKIQKNKHSKAKIVHHDRLKPYTCTSTNNNQ